MGKGTDTLSSTCEHNQNFWQLASIQSSAMGLPVILVGHGIAAQYGIGAAISSVLIGNFILWIIALAIISMASESRLHALQNVRVYMGRVTAIVAAFILIFAFLNWFTMQVNAAANGLGGMLDFKSFPKDDLGVRIGVALGLFAALFSMGGIRLIKWVAVASLPLLILFQVYAVVISGAKVTFEWGWAFSLPGVITVVTIVLPGVVNLPTFFRHSRSRADSFLGIAIMTLLVSLFQIASIWSGWIFLQNPALGSSLGVRYSFMVISASAFLLLAYMCINLVNIYFASAGVETLIGRYHGAKEYAIIGLAGTAVYTFIQIEAPMKFIENLANSYVASLGIVMLISFMIRIIIQHRPRPFEKLISSVAWFFGCLAATLSEIHNGAAPAHSILVGVGTSTLFFLFVIFVEETIWSLKHLSETTKKTRPSKRRKTARPRGSHK